MANSNTTRNMMNGAYHRHLFRDERKLDEKITKTRDGTIASAESNHNNLTNPLADALNAALLKKTSQQ